MVPPRNFGIVKHPGTGATTLATQSAEDGIADAQVDAALGDGKPARSMKKDASTAQEQLARKGFILMKWCGKCEADKVSVGVYDVHQDGMFGLVFDNTFSKQTSKTATFVLLTYPTGVPPQYASHLPKSQAGPHASVSKTSLAKQSSPRLDAFASESADSLHSHPAAASATAAATGPRSVAVHGEGGTSSSYHVGNLLKRRRKKGQGYARRFFSLDYTTCTLSYFHNRHSSALRGATPLSLAAIAADERRREISIDSGAEVWHLKASNAREFFEWARALQRASRIARGREHVPAEAVSAVERGVPQRPALRAAAAQLDDQRDWQHMESLVSRIVGTRDALRRLVKDLATRKYASAQGNLSPGAPGAEDADGYFTQHPERRLFWRRKSTASPLTTQAFQPTLSSALAVASSSSVTSSNVNGHQKVKEADLEETIYDHCAAILGDLDSAVAEFSNLLAAKKRSRLSLTLTVPPRSSLESTSTTEEFFDAEAGEAENRSRVLMIDDHSEEETPASEVEEVAVGDSSSVSSAEDGDEFELPADGAKALFPPRPKSLAPLPITHSVVRRKTIPPPVAQPPSLIAFVRKNVGKDLSTISMPVSANEPTSLLQRMAEQLEYAQLLNAAAKQNEAKVRLCYVAAFAISQFSSGRAKERATRKPFNPLLGETFELVRTESEVPGGLRLLVEKISHRPVRLAMQADAAAWSLAQSPAPTQKFWGKSAELTTEGRVRVALRLPDGSDELYSWNVATVFLRNVVIGEKYVEPVGTMHVTNDSTGAKATIEFRSKGMFGGRGEEVHVECVEPDGTPAGVSLAGAWTSCLKMLPAGEEIWRIGQLVDNAACTYGLTTFAASLNEITSLEQGQLPLTDCRLRPDQRLVEAGKLEEAEAWKVKLEEGQRRRRRAMDEAGEEHRVRWFVKVATAQDGDEVWRLKGGKEGYWEERAKGSWKGVPVIFAV